MGQVRTEWPAEVSLNELGHVGTLRCKLERGGAYRNGVGHVGMRSGMSEQSVARRGGASWKLVGYVETGWVTSERGGASLNKVGHVGTGCGKSELGGVSRNEVGHVGTGRVSRNGVNASQLGYGGVNTIILTFTFKLSSIIIFLNFSQCNLKKKRTGIRASYLVYSFKLFIFCL